MTSTDDDHVSSHSTTAPTTYSYPFAAAPDIIRSHQKDAYFQGILLSHISTLLRKTHGARFLHTYATEARTAADILYLGLTTLLGNRTLGEEYCDILHLESDTSRLPSISRRAGYILSAVLFPYGINKILPPFRSRIRAKLESNLRRLTRQKATQSKSYRLQSYILAHLSTITSPSPLHALTLIVFYFSGTYYELSKRIFGLRYIFSKRVPPSEARVGYEVLGVLLVLQVAVQSFLHVRSTLSVASSDAPVPANPEVLSGGTALVGAGREVSLDPNAYTSNNELLFESSPVSAPSQARIAHTTQTPALSTARYDLTNAETMGWIGGQQRKCTLCLDEMKEPAATACGHFFCWACISDWVREKAECPLCRRDVLAQHILPLRG
jgi:peroxin-10